MIVHGLLLLDPAEKPTPGWLRVDGGRIVEVCETSARPPDESQRLGGPGRLITPGFIDAHLHPPQFDAVGCDGMPLMDWIDRIVYPAEIWWGRGAAASITRRCKRAMLTQGTLGFAAYLTSHGIASHEAVAELERTPSLRAIVGRVAMDRRAPDELTGEDRHFRVAQSPPVQVAIAKPESPRLERSVNPRFAPACSEELLAEIGWFIQEHPQTLVQTHLAEAVSECELVRSLFPDDPNYTSVYDRFGLLTRRTVLAHCLHLSPAEWELIAARGSVVAHCPAANLFLQSGLFDLDTCRDCGIRIALGSDLAAGPDLAMPRVARAMIETAKVRRLMVAPHAWIPTPADVWRQITRGNAEALGWMDSGRLEAGAWADLLILRPAESWFDEHLIGRLLYGWSPELIEHRVVAGELANPATI